MTHSDPFTIRIFAAEGHADGLQTITKANWDGLIVVCDRSSYPAEGKGHRNEFTRSGMYILVGPKDARVLPTLHVGQSNDVSIQLDSHLGNKAFWQQVVVFTDTSATPLNESQLKHIEARLYELAEERKRCLLAGRDAYQPNYSISKADEADAELYLQEMLLLAPMIGIDAFEETPEDGGRTIYSFSGKDGKNRRYWKATGYEDENGFVVRIGSKARHVPHPSCTPYDGKLLAQLKDIGLLKDTKYDHFAFTKSHLFNSASQAASIVAGKPVDGKRAWTTEDERTLEDTQQSQPEMAVEDDED